MLETTMLDMTMSYWYIRSALEAGQVPLGD